LNKEIFNEADSCYTAFTVQPGTAMTVKEMGPAAATPAGLFRAMSSVVFLHRFIKIPINVFELFIVTFFGRLFAQQPRQSASRPHNARETFAPLLVIVTQKYGHRGCNSLCHFGEHQIWVP